MPGIKNYLLFACLLFSVGCHGSRSAENPLSREGGEAEKPHILFLTVTIVQADTTTHEQVWLRDVFLTDGKLKADYADRAELLPSHFLCSFLDEGGNVVKQVVVENPLRRSYEVPGDDGLLTRKIYEVDSGDFTLRTGWNPHLRRLKVESITDSEPPKAWGEIANLPIEF